jgi:anaerobic magnesium-protoporphyrin IX monomethyl ester cyclase
MRILLINPPHTAIGSRVPDDHLPPLGLLSIGGPLIDAGHGVRLVDADRTNMKLPAIIADALAGRPEVVLIGHSGSTTVHPTARAIASSLKAARPDLLIVYGGVFPTYHWREVLAECPEFDVIVRGEGEETAVELMERLEAHAPLASIAGLAFRDESGKAVSTRPRQAANDLDRFRIGWELIDHRLYSYWGGKRAVVMQFSRGCPHLCNYCGQRGFWTRWRHRDPVKFAAEIARLYREHGVDFINLADENPTSSKKAWKAFLEAMIAENVPVQIAGSTRADDIVRDADILHLYRRAGIVRWLLGMENTDDATLKMIQKGGGASTDREAVKLLRKHDIISMGTWVVGFEEERFSDLWRGFRQLRAYDPDQIQMLYVTPHRWTPYFRIAKDRTIVEPDMRKWDYKHQVLSMRHFHPVMLVLTVKLIEVMMQARPKAIARILFHRDPVQRHSMRWYTKMGRRVWFRELFEALFSNPKLKHGPRLEEFWGAPQDAEEESMQPPTRRQPAPTPALVANGGEAVR